ncbi:MAG: hypothetical protein R3276_01630 [Marinobacter sp.]|nr:hypothetical protein [Marinobacter sp.]
MNTLLKALGYLALTLLVLVVLVVVWFGINASKNTELAQPYFENNLATIVGWDLEPLAPMLTPSLLSQLQSEEGQRYLRKASRLGDLQSFERLQFLGASTDVDIDGKRYDLMGFTLLAHFAGGDAELDITLAQSGDITLVHDIRIRSSVMPE